MKYRVGPDGKAPPGMHEGDEVFTEGGTYTITGVNPDGSYTSELTDPNAKLQRMSPELEAAANAGLAAQASSGGGNKSNYNNGSDSSTNRTAEDYINSIYDAQIAAKEARLKSAYDQQVNALNAEKTKIPVTYGAAKNQTAAESETQRANFNEYAAASGLNSGAGGQASLAFGNQLQGNLASLNQAQADAVAGIDLRLTNLQIQYQTELAQAFADGNLEKVKALYENYENNKSGIMNGLSM